MQKIMQDETEIENRIYVFPNSALKENNKKINYLDFLSHTRDRDCLNALMYVWNHYDQIKIFDILTETEMSETKKVFYGIMIKNRSEKVLKKALELQKDYCIKTPDNSYVSRNDFPNTIFKDKELEVQREKKSRTYDELER